MTAVWHVGAGTSGRILGRRASSTWIIVVLWPSRCSLAADGTSIQAPTAGPLPAQPESQMIAERFRTILLTHFPNRRDPLRPVLLAVRH
uniref:Putative secreted peptide n=1 Tax=Anopheles braziliensis TaxID=58242 RepID=A0A2M3ZUA4_9DIPT